MNAHDLQNYESRIEKALDAHDIPHALELCNHYLVAVRAERGFRHLVPSLNFRAMFLTAQAELAAARPSAAIERFAELADDLPKVTPELACRVHLSAAETLARLGRVAEALDRLGEAERTGFPIRSDDESLLQWLRTRLTTQDFDEIAAEVKACDQFLFISGKSAARAVLAGDMGMSLLRTGDPERATDWSRSLELARTAGVTPML